MGIANIIDIINIVKEAGRRNIAKTTDCGREWQITAENGRLQQIAVEIRGCYGGVP